MGEPGVCDQKLKGQDVPGCPSHCLLPLGTDAWKACENGGQTEIALMCYATNI